ncbi:unnamed protein product [Rotaria sp. Silwood2]|nr:unnamed protein product [Rotaria sp. Silwood2]
MCDQYRKSYRLGRRPGEQGPRPLSRNQNRVEKLTTGTTATATVTTTITTTTTPIAPSMVTTGITRKAAIVATTATKYETKTENEERHFYRWNWNVQTLWAAGKLELLGNEMKQYRYDVIGISEVRWTGRGEISNGDFIWSGENNTHTRGVGILLSTKAKKSLLCYNPINSRIVTARFNATPFNVTIIHVYASTGDWNAKVGTALPSE